MGPRRLRPPLSRRRLRHPSGRRALWPLAPSILAVALAAGVCLSLVPTGATVAQAASSSCSPAALRAAKGTVNIDFWESMTQANATTLQSLTSEFNSSQSKVHVTLVQQADYTTTWVKYQAGLSNGQLPALVQLTETGLQGVVDTRSIVPAQTCIAATHYSTADFVPRTLAYYKLKGVQQGMPFAVSIPITYYNKQAFSAAGLNPTVPPATLAQYVTDAKALKAHGSGTGLVVYPWLFRNWMATANQLMVNNGNGRNARATRAVFASSSGVGVWSALNAMVQSGAAVTNPATGPDAFDNLLGIGDGKYGMTIETSAALGTVVSLVSKYPNVTLGVGPFPLATARSRTGVSGGGSALYVSNRVPAAQQAAAWAFTTFLDNPQSQATWAAGTGYIPIRRSSVQTATIRQLWATQPYFKVAYDQLLSGSITPASTGQVAGPYLTITTAIVNGENSMFVRKVSPAQALASTNAKVTSILANYNQRLGAT